jgi:hypothetical protein
LDEHGQTVARADLRIAGTRRLVEYDGAHHRDARQYERDRARARQMQALGWVPYSYSATTVRRQPQLILAGCRSSARPAGRPRSARCLAPAYPGLDVHAYRNGPTAGPTRTQQT